MTENLTDYFQRIGITIPKSTKESKCPECSETINHMLTVLECKCGWTKESFPFPDRDCNPVQVEVDFPELKDVDHGKLLKENLAIYYEKFGDGK